jgi:serine/threonine protein phosphatase 1
MTRASLTLRAPQTPPNTVAYAVGDIHGRLDLLEGFLADLQRTAEAAARDGKRVVVVFLGDYIDRGPGSAGVVERLSRLRDGAGCEFVFLRGNHEQVLLDLVDEQENTTRWLNFGGQQTLASYGVAASAGQTVESLHALVQTAVPPHHVRFLRDTRLTAQVGDYFFVHAGLRPDRLVEEQSDSDLLWFRYYEDEAPVWDHMVVHGHSPNSRPVVGRWRIAIDTEAHASGALTALRMEGDQQTLLRISEGAAGKIAVTPWDEVDRSYRGAPGERPRSGERPDVAPRLASRRRPGPAVPEAAPRPAPTKVRRGRRGRRLAWGAGGALAVAACTALMLGARPGARAPEPAAPRAAQQAPQPDVQLRDAAAIYSVPADAAAQPPAASATPEPAAAAPAAQPEIAAAPPETAAPAGPVVQVAAVDTEDAARAYWARLQKKLPAEAASRTLRIEAVERDGHSFQRVLLTGFESAKAAASFCKALEAVDQACLVRAR